MNASDLSVKIRITDGDALFDSLRELADLARQQADLSGKIVELSREIAQFVKADATTSEPN